MVAVLAPVPYQHWHTVSLAPIKKTIACPALYIPEISKKVKRSTIQASLSGDNKYTNLNIDMNIEIDIYLKFINTCSAAAPAPPPAARHIALDEPQQLKLIAALRAAAQRVARTGLQ